LKQVVTPALVAQAPDIEACSIFAAPLHDDEALAFTAFSESHAAARPA
jgi:hypothetical protein